MFRELNENERKVLIYLEIRTKVEVIRLEDVLNEIQDITVVEVVKSLAVLKTRGFIVIGEFITINR